MPCPPAKETTTSPDNNSKLSLTNIVTPTNLDVLCGRGVATNRHVGNESFRALVKRHKEKYVCSTKATKMKMSRYIVQTIRSQDGRFLEKDTEKNVWMDIGDKKAIEKTSQALRDGAAPLRKQLAEKAAEKDRLNATTSKEEIPSNKNKNKKENSMIIYPEPKKEATDTKQTKEHLQGIETDGKKRTSEEAGLNITEKDLIDSEKSHCSKKIPPSPVTRMITQETMPKPISVASHHSVAPASILSQHTHFTSIDGPTTVSPVQNKRSDEPRPYSPLANPQCNQVTAAVSPPNNISKKDDCSISPLHHVPTESMDKYDWLSSQQSTSNNGHYGRGHHCHTNHPGSGYDYDVSPDRTLPPPNPAIISSISTQKDLFVQYRKENISPSQSPQQNRYNPAAIGHDSPDTSCNDSRYTTSGYPKMQMTHQPLRGWERERGYMQNQYGDFGSKKRSYAYFEGRRDTSQPNMVETSLEDASQTTFDNVLSSSYGGMSPLPYTSDDEGMDWTMALCKQEESNLNWDVPDGLRHRFLMNLIQSPLLD